ncbi:uncharacterized protein LOC100679009 [Nasonia vitripennis]|uniref:Uncharacterized protein n=1 Tax=Nasonia vitripennis TaxID=7425 RepID=A0A7M7GL76_NASVI|nr:uncharacterized protein LOC100679009 [Nasonia vitripennis]
MSWITVTVTAVLLVGGVTCSPIDVPKPASELLPLEVDNGSLLATDMTPPPVSMGVTEKNVPATYLVSLPLPEERTDVDSKNENDAIKQIMTAMEEKKVLEATGEPGLDYSLKLVKVRRKRTLKYKKKYYGGGCGGGCGYYRPQPTYYKVVVVPVVVQKKHYYPQRTCNVCGHGGGYGGSFSYSQASASSFSYGKK